MPSPFVLAATIETSTPLDAWAGVDGLGFDGKMFFTTGVRQGGLSQIWVHDDRKGDANWVKETEDPSGHIETFNKIRDWKGRLYVWAERPNLDAGQSCLISRPSGSAVWTYDTQRPISSSALGGRALGTPLDGQTGRLYHGQEDDPFGSSHNTVYAKDSVDGPWELFRERDDTLLWELEYDGLGRLWEFYSAFAGTGTAATFVGGGEIPSPPGGDISHAAWFPVTEQMYVCGGLSGNEHSTAVSAFRNEHWEQVFALPSSIRADHVQHVPRGGGELWVSGHGPLQVFYSLDGSTWVDAGLPALGASEDTNHQTALCYYAGRVWVLARDADAGVTRAYREARPSVLGGGRRRVQII